MKLLDQYIDPNQAAAARHRLREAGIASWVDTMDPHSIQPSRSGTTHIGLWVLQDDQFDDAIKILVDPEHVARVILSPDQIDRLESSAEKQSKPKRPFSEVVMTIALLAGLMALILYTAIDFFIGL